MASKETLKKFRSKLKKGLPKKIKSQLKTTKLGRTAKATAQMASNLGKSFKSEAAKHSLDQVLLNLEHRGLSIKDSQDLAIKVGKKVLERAEAIRQQIAENPLSPAWLKEVRLKCADESMDAKKDESLETSPVAVSSENEATISEAAQGMAEPIHKTRIKAGELNDEIVEPATKVPPKTKRAGARKNGAGASRAVK